MTDANTLFERFLACVGPIRSVEIEPGEQAALALDLLARAPLGGKA